MGTQRKGAIVGYAEWPTVRRYDGPRRFMLEQWMDLAAEALADAGLALGRLIAKKQAPAILKISEH